MKHYVKIIEDILEDLVAEGDESRVEILKRWAEGDTRDDLGNLTGSRECSSYKAELALKEAGFPFNEDLNELLIDAGYDMTIIEKGPEAVDVILCEVIAPQIAFELLES